MRKWTTCTTWKKTSSHEKRHKRWPWLLAEYPEKEATEALQNAIQVHEGDATQKHPTLEQEQEQEQPDPGW